MLARLPYAVARWPEGDFKINDYEHGETSMVVLDRDELPVVLFRNEWSLRYAQDRAKNVTFREEAPRKANQG
jgi:peptide chain release factor 3